MRDLLLNKFDNKLTLKLTNDSNSSSLELTGEFPNLITCIIKNLVLTQETLNSIHRFRVPYIIYDTILDNDETQIFYNALSRFEHKFILNTNILYKNPF